MTDLERKIETYLQRGWHPVKWAHHPDPIKDAIRAIGFRPKMKSCFENCQRFVIGVDRLGIDLDVIYREGWAIALIPITHAWLEYEGAIVDLTLDDRRPIRYLESTAYSVDQIRMSMIKTQAFTLVNERRLLEISPFKLTYRGE